MNIVTTPDISLEFRIYFAIGVSIFLVLANVSINLLLKKKSKPADSYLLAGILAITPITEKLFHGEFIVDIAIQSTVLITSTILLSLLIRSLPQNKETS